jgi:MFS family permease
LPANTQYSAINGILAMDAFTKHFNTGYVDVSSKGYALSPSQTAIIVAILSAGTAIGALIAAPCADAIGRRLSLLISVGVFCFGVIFQVCADAIPMLLVGRYVGRVELD